MAVWLDGWLLGGMEAFLGVLMAGWLYGWVAGCVDGLLPVWMNV
jgi:hypothetical protein